MDFANKALAQASELCRSLSPAARVAAALLVVVMAVSAVYLFQPEVIRGDEFLLDGRPFSASELTSIEAAFAQAGLGGSTVAGNQIRIPRGQKAAYLAALADANALPADFYKHFDDALASENPFVSSRSLELKHSHAKMKELALIISRMQGIESATVQFDEEARTGLARTGQKTAMVAVWTTGGNLGDDQVRAIRNVVSSAYAGLPRGNITITDMTSHLTFGPAAGPESLEGENVYASYKLQYERNWQRKIADQLSMIPGVKVNVNVEMWPETRQTSMSATHDSSPLSLSSRQSSARPMGIGNQPIAVTPAEAVDGATSVSQSQQPGAAGQEPVDRASAPLAPKHVTAAIDVPASYYAKVWRERNQTLSAQSLPPGSAAVTQIETEVRQRIRETVRQLLPAAPGTDPYAHITVSTYTELPARALSTPTAAALAQAWLAENWRTAALVLLGCFCLLVVRNMVRASATSAAPAASAALASAGRGGPRQAASDEDIEDAASDLATRRQLASSADLKSELRHLVKENPDAAASVLRTWIGDAA